MSTVAKRPETKEEHQAQQAERLPALAGPRLPYHPAIETRFGVDKASWKALVEAIFPNATTTESVILALSYCRARKLDPFKRNVHIVPIWDKVRKCMVDTIWPGIGELRTTAFRTGEFAGRGATVFGPDLSQKVGSVDMIFPEWAQVTVYRFLKGQRVEFAGPRVYWIETYATLKRDDDSPNDMWKNRPRGQIDKCAEAAALRGAFPEECGGDFIPEEVQHAGSTAVDKTKQSLDELAHEVGGTVEGSVVEREPGDDTETEAASTTHQEGPPEWLDEACDQLSKATHEAEVKAIIAGFEKELSTAGKTDGNDFNHLVSQARARIEAVKK